MADKIKNYSDKKLRNMAIGIIRKKENISVQVVVKAFSLLIQNMIQVRDGHVSLMLKISNT